MITDTLPLKGKLDIKLYDEFGMLKEHREVPNLVVTTGLNNIAERLVTGATAVMSYMAVGTSSTAPVLGQTTLVAQSATVALTSTSVAGSAVSYVASFPAGTGTALLTEAGIFNNSSGGVMLARSLFTAIDKGSSDTLTITWTITLG